MDENSLQAEVERLRAEVESYKQREFDSLKAENTTLRNQLAVAYQDIQALHGECQRLSLVGKEIDINAKEIIGKLQAQLEAKQRDEIFRQRQALTKPRDN